MRCWFDFYCTIFYRQVPKKKPKPKQQTTKVSAMAKTHANGQKKKIVTLKSAEATDGVKKKKKKKPSKLKKMILLVCFWL